MADIKQAAKWIEEGKLVRRKSEPLEVFDASHMFGGAVMVSRHEMPFSFARMTVEQLLADDWELTGRRDEF